VRAVYLDNAATSWPKPAAVLAAMRRYFFRCGGNPGRSGHAKAVEAGRTVLATRERLAELFGVQDPSRIVFTKNATEALNLVFSGLLKPGDRVVTSSMEHNSVLRPLTALERQGVWLTVVQATGDGQIDPEAFCRNVDRDISLAVVTQVSNVTGAITDLDPIGAHCRKMGVPLLVDAAQSAGCLPIDVEALRVDFLAFSGHKGLLGPQGTGGLYIRSERGLEPLVRGGTGSLSDREEQPEFLPDRYESGTLNVVGLAGLGAGVGFLSKRGVGAVRDHERRLLEIFLEGVDKLAGVKVQGPRDPLRQAGVVSLTFDGLSPSEAGQMLEDRFGILSRIGLHCAPRAHRTLGTFPEGTVRLSWGVFTRPQDIIYAVKAVRALAGERRGSG